MIPVYNEEDIIEEVINHLLSQGIELVILDNGSIDDTFDICKKYVGKGLLKLEKFETDSWNASLFKEMLYHMAIEQKPDWVILNDADELLECPKNEINLKNAIENVDKHGCNLIQFNRFDFFMTNEDKSEISSVKERMMYYSYQGDYVYRIWKYFPGIRIGDTAGHYPIFPENHPYRVYREKFIMRHYPFRTNKQASKKMVGRTRGSGKAKNKVSLNGHYKKIISQDYTKKFDSSLLSKYEDSNWNYNLNFQPFETFIPPKREELFTADGFLRNPPLSAYELKLLLNEKWNKSLVRKAYRKFIPKKNQ